MQKPIEWRPGTVRASRDLTHDIRMIEIVPAGEFVAPTPGGHIKISVMIGERPDVAAIRSSDLAPMAPIASRSSG